MSVQANISETMKTRRIWSAAEIKPNWPLRFFGLVLIGVSLWGFIFTPSLYLSCLLIAASLCVVIMSVLRICASLYALARLNAHSNPFSATFMKQIRPVTHLSMVSETTASIHLAEMRLAANLWPKYTVLVPLHDEAHMVPELFFHLSRLDYPKDRLQILVITEASDQATINAVIEHLNPPFKNIVVPYSWPQTKPKALNVAMQYAEGDFITIYDAEDRPHPAQLKIAAHTFSAHPELAALQAPLEYFNSDQNWLTRQFALEYAALFHVWNPFLAKIGLPFPLGGTSNHIRTEILKEVDLWDSYNVTEDADLTFRLAAFGHLIGTIGAPTQEEAVSEYKNWSHQRQRWVKGFLQTWIVHMRHIWSHGFKRFVTLQITLGFTILSSYLHVPATLALLYLAITGQLPHYDSLTFYLIGATLGLGYGSTFLSALTGSLMAKRPYLIWDIIFMPFYWLMLFIPSLAAAYQYFRMPYKWNKTRHGDYKSDLPELTAMHDRLPTK